jgi:hypothetical protein
VAHETQRAYEALRRRIEEYVEHAREDGVADRSDVDWADVIYREAAFLAAEGPAAYLRYVAALDDAGTRRDLDRELDVILRGEQ